MKTDNRYLIVHVPSGCKYITNGKQMSDELYYKEVKAILSGKTDINDCDLIYPLVEYDKQGKLQFERL